MPALCRLAMVSSLAIAALLPLAAQAEISLPAVIGEDMVLQRDASVLLWGWARPREQVSVGADWLSSPVTTTADLSGRWQVHVSTPDAGGPHTLTFSGENTITLGNVLIGEVWVCSGQSNMEWPLFNGMIAPLAPFSIRGAIWYQGESNRGRPEQYRTLFPGMITDWREHWGCGDFPFYFVQIAPYRYKDDPDLVARLREAQAGALQLPHTGMVVTMDVGNPDDIHPTNKQAVGHRLALWALAKTYDHGGIAYSGPLYRGMKIESDRVWISFDHVDGGLTSGGQPLTEFTIAAADRVFHKAQATIDGETVVVWSDEVPQPAAVRFAWSNAPQPNLKNKAGLPAAPFRTDDWDRQPPGICSLPRPARVVCCRNVLNPGMVSCPSAAPSSRTASPPTPTTTQPWCG